MRPPSSGDYDTGKSKNGNNVTSIVSAKPPKIVHVTHFSSCPSSKSSLHVQFVVVYESETTQTEYKFKEFQDQPLSSILCGFGMNLPGKPESRFWHFNCMICINNYLLKATSNFGLNIL